MFGIFKKIFGKEGGGDTTSHPFIPPQRATRPVSGLASRPTVHPDKPGSASGGTTRHTRPASSQGARPRSIQTSFLPKKAAAEETRPESDSGERISLSLQTILNNLPAELQCRVAQNVPDYVEVSFSRDKILSQLASGSVKFSFGELRLVAPHGTLMPQNDRDHMAIELPLAEVLARVSPATLPRRSGQRKIVVPEDITGPFGNQCQGISIAAKPARPAPAAPPVVTPQEDELVTFTKRAPAGTTASEPAPAKEQPEPARIPAPRIPQAPTVRLQSQTTSFKARPPAPAPSNGNNGGTTSHFPRPTQKPIIKIAPPSAREQTPAPLRIEPPAPQLPAEPEVIPFKPVAHVPAKPAPAPTPAPAPAPKPALRPSAPQSTPLPSVALSGAIITMPIMDLWESWPDAVKDEIAQLGLTDAKISVPLELIEAALKQGRVSFSWRLMRSWVRPAVQFGAISPHEGVVLDLPLKVVAPAFLSRHRDAAERKRVELAGDIPDIWSGSKPASFDTTVTRPKTRPSEQTNYYVWDEASDSPVIESSPVTESQTVRPARTSPAGGDTNYATRFSSPTEVVKKATSIPGVAGALVALEDGLLVASSLTHDVNGDTLAAFIPQAFVRVSQTTKELMMGELNNLNFTLGTTPWKIFRVGSLYFAVYGRPGEPLPTARIAGLAAELERKPR